jgi:hypothetical protein
VRPPAANAAKLEKQKTKKPAQGGMGEGATENQHIKMVMYRLPK